jgi:hypothetical protein
MREAGKATSSEDLKTWANTKLVYEIKKQIRRDFGGEYIHERLDKVADQFALESGHPLSDQAKKILVEMIDNMTMQVRVGSLKRITPKLEEILRRLEE